MKLKPAEHPGPIGPLHRTGVRLRRYDGRDPEADLDRKQLAAALDCAKDALVVVDRVGRVRLANVAAAHLLGADRARMQCGYIQNYLEALDGAGHVFDRAVLTPASFRVALPDGGRARAELTPLEGDDERPTHACIRLAPEQDPAAEGALEVIGRLLSELAHDLNNQLSAALNYVFIVRRRTEADPALAPHLEELQGTAWRAASLAAGLKLLGPKRNAEAERLRLGEVLDALAPVLRHVAGTRELELRIEQDMPALELARGHLEQLLVVTTLAAAARARTRGAQLAAVEARESAQRVRVSWLFASAGTAEWPSRSGPLPSGARAPSALRRALERCHARPGHDAERIWIDLNLSNDTR